MRGAREIPTAAAPAGPRRTPVRRLRITAVVLAVAWTVSCLSVAVVNVAKPLPAGLAFEGAPISLAGDQVRFLADLTYQNGDGTVVHRQQIFDAMLERVTGARRRLMLDVFLYNPFLGAGGAVLRPLSAELTTAIATAVHRQPGLAATLITDPVNDVYGGDPSDQLRRLADAGVEVVRTDLGRLRDSNPVWSAPWRLALSRWGNRPGGGWLPHPLDSERTPVTLRTWLTLLNFKANHRKVLVADDEAGQWSTLVTSLNPHGGSSAHCNVALVVSDPRLAHQVLAAEHAVTAFSGGEDRAPLPTVAAPPPAGADHTVRYLTESAIRDALLAALQSARAGDEVLVAVFYLAHAGILDGLEAAAARGAAVRIVLDPNRDAFGHAKNGIPNRQSAHRVVTASGGAVGVRWYDTHGEQFHPKLLLVRRAARSTLLLGSANFTRRNLDDYNLEADLEVTMPRGAALDRDVSAWFDRIWSNLDGHYTVPYDAYRDDSSLRRLAAWWQEHTGMGTF